MAEEKRNPWCVPDYPPLKCDDAVGQAAVNGQLVHYPKVVRSMDDMAPPNQMFSALSFMLFKEPRKLRSGKPVYGYVKTRGTFSTKDQATNELSKLIREQDSKFVVNVVSTGSWVPITEDTTGTRETVEVRTSDDADSMRAEAMKEKEETTKRQIREIKEREEELKTAGDIYDDPESLRYFTMKMVTHNMLIERRNILRDQIKSVEENIEKTQHELFDISSFHTEYEDEWIDCYNAERRKGGLPDFVPSQKEMDEYEAAMKKLKEEGVVPKRPETKVLNKEEPVKQKQPVTTTQTKKITPQMIGLVTDQVPSCSKERAEELLIKHDCNFAKAIIEAKENL